MSDQDAFERVMASLHDAMIDEARWPATTALIDEACGSAGNALLVGEGPKDDVRVTSVGPYYQGQLRADLEREYLEVHPIDEAVPRMRKQPYGRLVHITDRYTAEELKTSRAFNEVLVRFQYGNSLAVRLKGLAGSYMTWGIGDPVASDGWGSSQIKMIRRLFPQIRQFVQVRQALVRAAAQSTTVTALLDNPRIGIVQLDRRGRILEANDRACGILRDSDGLSDRDGVLRAQAPDDELCLARLVAAALPTSGAVAVSGSMVLHRSFVLPPFAVYVKPVSLPQPDYGARHVAALVLIVEPGRQHRVDPHLVTETLGLTPAEGQVATWLAEGKSVREIAEATRNSKGAIYWHLKQTYQKLSISRQVDLVRVVLSFADLK